jgi:chromate reductase
MTVSFEVAVLVGSLRKGSITRRVARALMAASPANLRCRFVDVDMPLYNEDAEAAPPHAWHHFRQEMASADAVLFVTPEYNRSLPGSLKNAVDVGSRPYGKGVWNSKPAGIVSVSPGKIGAMGANMALRQTLVFVDVPVMQQPEAYISGAHDLFEEDGTVKNAETSKFIENYMVALSKWVTKLASEKG